VKVGGSAKRSKYELWKARLDRSHRLWDDYRTVIQKYYDSYEGYFEEQDSNPNYIHIPLAFAHVKFRIPSLLLKNPFVKVTARTPFERVDSPGDFIASQSQGVPSLNPEGQPVRDNVLGAEILENALNYELKAMRFKAQAKRAIMDALFCYGVIKVGYHTEYTYNPAQTPLEIQEAELAGRSDRETLEWNASVKRESVWAIRVDPWDFRFDPDIKMLDEELSQCRWVAFRSIRPLDDVKSDPLYKNTTLLEGTAYPDDFDSDEGKKSSQQDALEEPYVILWEIWDKKEQKIYVIAEGHDDFLREDDWPYDMDGFPCSFLAFNDLPTFRRYRGIPQERRVRGPLPISDLAEWHELNHIVNITESMAVESYKRKLDKLAVQEGTIDDEELVNLTKPLSKGVVKMKDLAGIKELKSTPSSGEENALIQRMMNWVFQISGVSAQQRGVNTESTATQSNIVQSHVEARQAESVDRVKDWALVVIQKLAQLMKQFFDKERIVPVIGREDFEWIPYTRENIQGEYDINIELLPYDPTKKEVKVKQLTDLLAIALKFPNGTIPNGMGGFTQVNVAKLIEMLFREMVDGVSIREFLSPSIAPPANPAGMPPGSAPSGAPGGPGGDGAPLPGEGKGADKRSMVASQGAGNALVQALRQDGGPQAVSTSINTGASSPSRGS